MDGVEQQRDAGTLSCLRKDCGAPTSASIGKRMDRLLAPDFLEIGRSGRVYRRAEILDTPAQPIIAKLPLMDFKARLLNANLAQVTYVSTVTYQGGRRALNPQLALVADEERVAAQVSPGDTRPKVRGPSRGL